MKKTTMTPAEPAESRRERPLTYLDIMLETYAERVRIPIKPQQAMIDGLSRRWGVSESGIRRWIRNGRVLIGGRNQRAVINALEDLEDVAGADWARLLRGPD